MESAHPIEWVLFGVCVVTVVATWYSHERAEMDKLKQVQSGVNGALEYVADSRIGHERIRLVKQGIMLLTSIICLYEGTWDIPVDGMFLRCSMLSVSLLMGITSMWDARRVDMWRRIKQEQLRNEKGQSS